MFENICIIDKKITFFQPNLTFANGLEYPFRVGQTFANLQFCYFRGDLLSRKWRKNAKTRNFLPAKVSPFKVYWPSINIWKMERNFFEWPLRGTGGGGQDLSGQMPLKKMKIDYRRPLIRHGLVEYSGFYHAQCVNTAWPSERAGRYLFQTITAQDDWCSHHIG